MPFRVLIFFALLTSAWAAPQLANPSFEELYLPQVVNVYGDGPVPGWTTVGRGGVNKLNDGPFANNGIVPHGSNVTYIQSYTPAEVPPEAPPLPQIFQDVPGFEAGRSYGVTFHCNSRAGFQVPILNVLLGDQVLISDYSVLAVEGDGSHSVAYHRIQSAEFLAPTAGTFTLLFRHRHIGPGDSALLLDGVNVVELGGLKLLSARRLPYPDSEVIAKFSAALQPELAQDPLNYSIDPSVQVLAAELMADPTQVRLQTQPLPEGTGPYQLKVIWLRDAATGRGMFATNSTTDILIPAAVSPTLQIRSIEDSRVEVSWPATEETAGFFLEMNQDLNSSLSWQPIPGTPEIQGLQYIWTENDTSVTTFYRLRR